MRAHIYNLLLSFVYQYGSTLPRPACVHDLLHTSRYEAKTSDSASSLSSLSRCLIRIHIARRLRRLQRQLCRLSVHVRVPPVHQVHRRQYHLADLGRTVTATTTTTATTTYLLPPLPFHGPPKLLPIPAPLVPKLRSRTAITCMVLPPKSARTPSWSSAGHFNVWIGIMCTRIFSIPVSHLPCSANQILLLGAMTGNSLVYIRVRPKL